MTSRRQQDLLEIAITNAAAPIRGDALALDRVAHDQVAHDQVSRDERLRLYWPADVLKLDAGAVALADPAWGPTYSAGLSDFFISALTLMVLNHPNLGRITEVVEASAAEVSGAGDRAADGLGTAQGRPALGGTVGAARGATLADWLATGTATRPAAVMALAADLAAGLEAAHAAGVLHLDIAPETIGLSGERASLFDFACDRRAFIALVQRVDHLFRPGYSAFETQDATGTLALGPSADVYGLSAVLYRVITGSTPPEWFAWTAETRLSALMLAKAYPAPLIQAIERGLSRLPTDRFATVADWAATANLALDVAPDRAWFDWPEDFVVPPSPAAPVDPLALALAPPPAPLAVADPVEPLGALTAGPWAAAGIAAPYAPRLAQSRPVEAPDDARRVDPPRRRTRAFATGLGGLALVGALGALALVAGGRSGDTAQLPVAAPAHSDPMPLAPEGCGWSRDEDTDGPTSNLAPNLVLSCGRGDGAERVDAGDLRPGDTASAASGDASAMTRLGRFYLRQTAGRDVDLGLDWLRRGAAAGSGAASLDLAAWYERQARTPDLDPDAGEASLRQALQWFQQAAPMTDGTGASGGLTIDQRDIALAGVERISAHLARLQDRAFSGCWRSAGGDVTAQIAVADDRFTLSIEGTEPASGNVVLPHEDGRLAVTLDQPALMRGQRYLFTREGAALIEHRLDASGSTARWDPCLQR